VGVVKRQRLAFNFPGILYSLNSGLSLHVNDALCARPSSWSMQATAQLAK